MKVILFIGHHKVGSTSLQQFLSQNYRALLQAGILYPSVESQGFSHNIASAFDPDFSTADVPINVREAHNALAFKMLAENSKRKVPAYHKNLPSSRQMLIAIKEQMAIFKPHTVILCAEVFANFAAVNRSLIETLRHCFEGHEVTLVCTLRRPDEYITSWHGQRLKFGQQLDPLSGEGLSYYFPTIHFDYKRMLASWLTVFKGSRLVLRDYQDVLASGGSVEDFIAHSGGDFPENLPISANSNPSIPRALMEIARQGNHVLSDHDAHDLRQYLLECGGRIKLPKNNEIEMFGAQNRALLMERFFPIHKWLSQISGQDVFFDHMEDAAQLRPIPEHEAAQAGFADVQLDAKEHLTNTAAAKFISDLRLD